jgi:hypothetical protein
VIATATGVISGVRSRSVAVWRGDENHLIYEPFLDKHRLAAVSGVSFAVNPPTKDAGNPLFPPSGSNTDTWDYYKGYCSVVKIGSTWHMHYRAGDDTTPFTSRICYATSSDGETWTKPNLGLVTYEGNTNNNILVDAIVGNSCTYDPRADVWVMTDEADESLRILTCDDPDGTFVEVKDLVPSEYAEGRQVIRRADGRWIGYYVIGQIADTRVIRAYVSDTEDLDGTWTASPDGSFMRGAGASDQFYGIGVTRIGEMHYGMVMRFSQATDLIWMDLWTSRNGTGGWVQRYANWIPVGASTAWDDSLIINGSLITEDGNDWHVYYAGQPVIHNSADPIDARIGRATIGKDRIGEVSGTGTVTTDLLYPRPGSVLTVNCDASGGGGNKIEIDVLDENGDAIDGFAAADMTDITTDTYATTPSWGGIAMPTGRTIRLRFNLTGSTLHAYRITAP